MGFLKEIGAAIGVGNLHVTVACDEKERHHGEPIHGVVTITGGEVPQVVQGLKLALARRWEVKDSSDQADGEGSRAIFASSMPLHLEVAPGSTHAVPFVLEVPRDLPLAAPGDWHTVDVTADIPAAIDVKGSCRIVLLPVPPVAEALAALASATGWTLDGYEPKRARHGSVCAVFSPGAEAAERFDRAYVEVALAGEAFSVHVTLDRKERFWKEVTGRDKEEHTFVAPDADALVAAFQKLLEPADATLSA